MTKKLLADDIYVEDAVKDNEIVFVLTCGDNTIVVSKEVFHALDKHIDRILAVALLDVLKKLLEGGDEPQK